MPSDSAKLCFQSQFASVAHAHAFGVLLKFTIAVIGGKVLAGDFIVTKNEDVSSSKERRVFFNRDALYLMLSPISMLT